jgi:hypothetical protein
MLFTAIALVLAADAGTPQPAPLGELMVRYSKREFFYPVLMRTEADGGTIFATYKQEKDGTRFTGLAGGTWILHGRDPELGIVQEPIELAAGEKRELDAPFKPGTQVEGRVVDAAGGKPVAGAQVGGSSEAPAGGSHITARTDKDGKFVLPNLFGTGRRLLKVEADGYETREYLSDLPSVQSPTGLTLKVRKQKALTRKQQMLWPGFSTRLFSGELAVTTVYPFGPMKELQPGDVLLKINGVTTKDATPNEVAALLDEKDPPQVEVRRDGKSLKVKLPAKARLTDVKVH